MTISTASAANMRWSNPNRVLIVGGGLAGLFAALKLAPLPVTVLSPLPLGEGASSAWAQGGIAAAIGEGDTPEAHAADTITVGGGLVDEAVAYMIARDANARIHDLLRYGVPFDHDLEGKLRLSLEAAHTARRIARVNGDQAGRAVMTALVAAVASCPSISVLEHVQAVDLAKADGRIVGVYARRSDNKNHAHFLPARAVVLATGGIGQLYRVTTNPKEAAGHGIGMAAHAGAIISNPEFVQFHPTAFDIGRDPAPLASEAIRGEGAKLVNAQGVRFMRRAHADAELAPRDIVARAVHREIAEGRGAYLDCRALNLETQFPKAFAICESAGINPKEHLIPVAPAAHYHMGGIFTDARGRSTVSGLWACGEVACTGMHGANRLASNSLLEAVVFAARVAEDIIHESSQWYAFGCLKGIAETIDLPETDKAREEKLRTSVRAVMTAHVGVNRNAAGLQTALALLASNSSTKLSLEMRNFTTAALFITVAALNRQESRGAHWRLDYPSQEESLRHSTFMDLKRAKAIATTVLQDQDGLDNRTTQWPVRVAS